MIYHNNEVYIKTVICTTYSIISRKDTNLIITFSFNDFYNPPIIVRR